MKRTFDTVLIFLSLAGSLQIGRAQSLILVAPQSSGSYATPITLNVVAVGDIGAAVAWGTTSRISDPLGLNYNTGFNGSGYQSLQPFFDVDGSDTSAAPTGNLSLFFLNSTPGAHFGGFGYNPLAAFQVQVSTSAAVGSIITVSLDRVGIPPTPPPESGGSAVLDDTGNNLLPPLDPNNPNNPEAIAYIQIASNHSWIVLDGPVAVPEPGNCAALTALAVVSLSVPLRQRRLRAHHRRLS